MIDIEFLKTYPEEAQILFEKRKCKVNVGSFLEICKNLNNEKKEFDNLKHQQKNVSREEAISIKQKINTLKESIIKLESEKQELWLKMPNRLAPDTPDGKDDSENVEIRRVGDIKKFTFEVKSHEIIGKKLNILDLERGAKVSGSGFYYLVGLGEQLWNAIYSISRQVIKKSGFKFLVPPVLASHRTFMGTGYFPFEPEQNFKIENQNLYPIGTSEQTLLAFRDNEILEEKELPVLYSALTPCFRTEAGSYGKASRGAFRVHQFHKMEQIVFCHPEESESWHEKCQKNIEEIMQLLEIPYRVVRVCLGDMGAPGYKKYDVEGWFPSFEAFRETHSNSNLTDFQTRRLNIRVNIDGKKIFPHTISSTAITDRALLAILENNQLENGNIIIPKVLRPFMDGLEIIS